jgi:hypothetical protein
MKKFVIEREIPGLGNLSQEELKSIAQSSCDVVNGLNKPYHWVQSFVTGDKMYCIHIAPDEATILEHAQRGGFPADRVEEVTTTIDPTTSA